MVPEDKVQLGRITGGGAGGRRGMWVLTFEWLYGPPIGVIRQEGEQKGAHGGMEGTK